MYPVMGNYLCNISLPERTGKAVTYEACELEVQVNELQEELIQNKTTKNMNLLLKTIDQRTKLLEKLSDKDESILDSIPVFN